MNLKKITIPVIVSFCIFCVSMVIFLLAQDKTVTQQDVQAILEKMDKAKTDEEITEAAKSLTDLGSSCMQYLDQLMRSMNIKPKIYAYKAMFDLGDTSTALTRLMNILRNHKDSEARIITAEILSTLGNSSLESQLIGVLETEKEPLIKIAVAKCLYITCKEVKLSLKTLFDFLVSDDDEIKSSAVLALAQINRFNNEVEDALQDLVEEPTEKGRLAVQLLEKRKKLRIFDTVSLPPGERPDTHDPADNEKPEIKDADKKEPNVNTSIFNDVLIMIQQRYLHKDKTDEKRLLDEAAREILNDLDPYSAYLPDESSYVNWQHVLDHEYPGIGIEIGRKGIYYYIISAIEGSPAYKAGLRTSDRIISIDDKLIYDNSLLDVSIMLRGEEKSQVKITVYRVGWWVPRTFTITREKVILPEVRWTKMPGDVGYIRIPYFQTDTAKKFRNALEKLIIEGVKGFIIDVRSNPGGLHDEAIKCADLLLKKGVLIVYTKGQNKTIADKIEYISDEENVTDAPVCVLVNFGTASAAEIFAGALGANKRAKILAERLTAKDAYEEAIAEHKKNLEKKENLGGTFGKAVKQMLMPVKSSEVKFSAINITVAFYYLSNDYRIHENGIIPDELLFCIAPDGWILNEYETPEINAKLDKYIENYASENPSNLLELAIFDNRECSRWSNFEKMFSELNTRAEKEYIRLRIREKARSYFTERTQGKFYDNLSDIQEDKLLFKGIEQLYDELKLQVSSNAELSQYKLLHK